MSTAPDATELDSTDMVELSRVESRRALWLHTETTRCILHCGYLFTPLHLFSTHERSILQNTEVSSDEQRSERRFEICCPRWLQKHSFTILKCLSRCCSS